jgi:protein-S-isoprenylcysteine O-methyltransferase Ste14
MTWISGAFRWGGGAVFVLALAIVGYRYAVTFNAELPWDGWDSVLIDLTLFTAFALHHSLFARAGVKAAMTAIVPEPLLRSVYVWIASLLLIGVAVLWHPVGGLLYHTAGWGAAAHAIVQVAGLCLIVWSVRAIDPLELAGIHTSPADASALVFSGAYHLVRHPLYLGWILVVFGAARMTGDRFTFATVSTCYLLIAIPWEERSLEDTFGEAYRRYRTQVRWRVVPYIY